MNRTVTTNADSGAGSLRQAILDSISGDTIDFGIIGNITITGAQLHISVDLAINGPGTASLSVTRTAGTGRLFLIDTGVVSITGLSIGGGTEAGDSGGGIKNETTLTLNDVSLHVCTAGVDGGALHNIATVVMSNCLINDNVAAGQGAGIYNSGTISAIGCEIYGNSGTSGNYNSATLSFRNGSIHDNIASVSGGGFYNDGGTLAFIESTVADNTAGTSGGGVYNNFGTTTFTRSTLSGNTTGIENPNGTIEFENSTVSGNSTAAIVNSDALRLSHSTVVANDSGLTNNPGAIFRSFDSILAGNTTDYTGDTADAISEGHNIFGVCTNPITPAAGDQSVLTLAALVIGPLQDNGGPTFTHALLATSPAIDAGDNASAPPTDQRKLPRVVAGLIDIGAYEREGGGTVTACVAGGTACVTLAADVTPAQVAAAQATLNAQALAQATAAAEEQCS